MAQLDQEDQGQIELAMTYRRVFSTVDGKIVLEDILGDLHLHDSLDTQNEAVLHNYAKLFCSRWGFCRISTSVRSWKRT